MSGPTVPPRTVAEVDQLRAQLAEIVGGVREHADADMCVLPAACPGLTVARALNELSSTRRWALLYVALAELATSGYGLPVHLTDAALAALDVPEGGDDDRDS